MTDLPRVHYIRIELPHDATPEEIEGLQQAVIELVEKKVEEYDYDINVSGGAWYPPTEESTEPVPVALRKLRTMVYARPVSIFPVDASLLRDQLQALQDLGMSQTDLQIHLECERSINEVSLRNMVAEDNLLTALDMVMGHVTPLMRVKFQAGTQ